MRLYLDNCCFNRPFDDQSTLTISLACEFFLTVDKGVLKKAKAVSAVQIMNPVEFIFEQGL